MVDSGSWYVHERWPHDGRRLESENFVVYSDAAGLEERKKVSETAEETWAEITEEFSIEPSMLRYPEGQNKLDIYAYRNRSPQDWSGRAYYAGVIMWSPDHAERRPAGVRFAPELKHELIHLLQWLIAGPDPDPNPVDTWFLEGLAEAMVGGTTGGAIRGMDQLDDLAADYGTVSPISVKEYSQITDPSAGERFNYPMFQLAVEYLFDPDGFGRTPTDARNVLLDVANGVPFEAAFEDRMGVGLNNYEREFFGLMDDYLPQYRNPVFSPAGFAILSALSMAFVVGAPAVGFRLGGVRRRSVRPLGAPGASATARIAFYGELTLAAAITIVFFLGGLYAAGTMYELNNTMYSGIRTRAYWTLGGCLLVSVGLMMWAVRKWARRSRAAYLVLPLVIGTTGFAAIAMLGLVR